MLGACYIQPNPKSVAGKTVHKIKEAKTARLEKACYVSAGPVFSTPLKKNLKERGVSFVKEIKKHMSRPARHAGRAAKAASPPVFAIGGINTRNVKAVLKSGVDGICVTRAISEVDALIKEIKK